MMDRGKVIRRIINRIKCIGQKHYPLADWMLNPYIHPLEISSGYEGHIVSTDGRDYIDLLCGWGTNILGHGYPRIAAAIAKQASRFTNVGMSFPEYRELKQLLLEYIPCAENVYFGKNGSDATLGAVRLSRAISKKDMILHYGYHGFHDWYMASRGCEGIPSILKEHVISLPLLTPEVVQEHFERYRGKVACLILDPLAPPIAGHTIIEKIRDIVHEYDALLIFDEVVSGFRVAVGGMQAEWGILPDLACYSKAMANGMPISALAGKEIYMRHVSSINLNLTFDTEAISIIAARETLKEIIEKNVCRYLKEKGEFLQERYNTLAADRNIPSTLTGHPARPYFEFQEVGDIPEKALRWLLIQELAIRNILTVGTIHLCFSHNETDLNTICKAFEAGLDKVKIAIESNTVKNLLHKEILKSMQ